MDENEKYSYQAVADEMDTVFTDTTSDALSVLLASLKLLILLELFRATYRGKMAVFWDSYIYLICLLLRFTRTMQEGILSLHLCYIREMLSWVFVYDRTNYARYLSVYMYEMTLLPRTHLNVNALLESGQFAVQRSSNTARGTHDLTNHEQGLQDKGRHQF